MCCFSDTIECMYEDSSDATGLLATEHLRSIVGGLLAMPVGLEEAESVDRLTLLEEIKSACTAAQVRETANLDALRAADEAARNVPERRRGRGLAAEIGLARKVSPRKGSQCLGFARALAHEMPHTLAALNAGVLTEWRATILVRETAHLILVLRREDGRRRPRHRRDDPDRATTPQCRSTRDRASTARTQRRRNQPDPDTRSVVIVDGERIVR